METRGICDERYSAIVQYVTEKGNYIGEKSEYFGFVFHNKKTKR